MRNSIAIAGAAAALFAAGCGKDTCPTESPQVSKVGTCTVLAGQTVNFPIRLCPTCNQTLTACDAQFSGKNIFLDPRVEACSNASSCPASCNLNDSTCTFSAPTTPDTYVVSAYDPAHPNTPQVGSLTVISSGPTSCGL